MKNILLWEGVLVLKSKYTQESTITKNILLWEGVLQFKCKYTQESTKKKKNFALGGCASV